MTSGITALSPLSALSGLSDLPAVAWSVVVPLLDEVPAAEDVRPGWTALLIVLGLAVVTVLLWLNMRKQLGKIKFDDGSEQPAADDEQAASSDADEAPRD